jgi:hypothetical protein
MSSPAAIDLPHMCMGSIPIRHNSSATGFLGLAGRVRRRHRMCGPGHCQVHLERAEAAEKTQSAPQNDEAGSPQTLRKQQPRAESCRKRGNQRII